MLHIYVQAVAKFAALLRCLACTWSRESLAAAERLHTVVDMATSKHHE